MPTSRLDAMRVFSTGKPANDFVVLTSNSLDYRDPRAMVTVAFALTLTHRKEKVPMRFSKFQFILCFGVGALIGFAAAAHRSGLLPAQQPSSAGNGKNWKVLQPLE